MQTRSRDLPKNNLKQDSKWVFYDGGIFQIDKKDDNYMINDFCAPYMIAKRGTGWNQCQKLGGPGGLKISIKKVPIPREAKYLPGDIVKGETTYFVYKDTTYSVDVNGNFVKDDGTSVYFNFVNKSRKRRSSKKSRKRRSSKKSPKRRSSKKSPKKRSSKKSPKRRSPKRRS